MACQRMQNIRVLGGKSQPEVDLRSGSGRSYCSRVRLPRFAKGGVTVRRSSGGEEGEGAGVRRRRRGGRRRRARSPAARAAQGRAVTDGVDGGGRRSRRR